MKTTTQILLNAPNFKRADNYCFVLIISVFIFMLLGLPVLAQDQKESSESTQGIRTVTYTVVEGYKSDGNFGRWQTGGHTLKWIRPASKSLPEASSDEADAKSKTASRVRYVEIPAKEDSKPYTGEAVKFGSVNAEYVGI